MYLRKILLLLLTALLGTALHAQHGFPELLNRKMNSFVVDNLQEKAYVQTSSNTYLPGDTLWFKGTLVNSVTHTPARGEKLIYIDFVSPDNKIIHHQVFILFGGFAAGCLPLKSDLPYGTYKLIAYTNYMRNFSKNFFFQRDIELLKPSLQPISWTFTQKQMRAGNGDSITVFMHAQTNTGKDIFSDADVSVQLARGTIMGGKAKLVNSSGVFSFYAPDSLQLAQATLTVKLPYFDHGTERYKIELQKPFPDIQFLPESGWLLPGISNKVAFKCIDMSGNPVQIEGKIYDGSKQFVTNFKSIYQGMGTFHLFPSDTSTYIAEVEWEGKKVPVKLPPVNPGGYGLHLMEETDDSLTFQVVKPTDSEENITLLSHTRGMLNFMVSGVMNERITSVSFPKKEMYGGIAVFTLIVKKYPRTERLVYIEPRDELNISVSRNKTRYNQRDKVDLEFKVTNAKGSPVMGSFTLNAFDLRLEKSIQPIENISNYLSLSSDITGTVFSNVEYFDKSNPDYHRNLDLLMLTNGWRRFNWPDIYSNLKAEKPYKVEKGLSLTGQVKRGINNKPVPKNFEVSLTLKQKNQIHIDKTYTNDSGKFEFYLPEFMDSANLVIQTRNRLRKQSDYLIDLETNLEKKNFNHLSFSKVNNIEITPVFQVQNSFNDKVPYYSMANSLSKGARKDNYYFPGKDTFLIEEIEVKSDYLTKRDSLIHQTGEPDVVIESAQLQKIVESVPWYSDIWDLLQNQVPGLLITRQPTTSNLQDKYNLVISDGADLVCFKVAGNAEGRLLIAVDGEFLHGQSVQLYDFLTLMDPSEIESINFISRPKKYENSTFNAENDVYSSALTLYNEARTAPTTSFENIETVIENQDMSAYSFLSPDGFAEIQANFDFVRDINRVMAPPSYLFITTKSKKGIFYDRPKGLVSLYINGFTNYKEFYSPKYETTKQKNNPNTDLRRTLHWDANIVTDSTGTASVSFYTSDSDNPMAILFQGLSVDGKTGVKYFELNSKHDETVPDLELPIAQKTDKEEFLYKKMKLTAGIILDAVTGSPITSANITAQNPYYHACTNNEGEYILENEQLAPGKQLIVSSPGYKNDTILFLENQDKLTVTLKKAKVSPPATSANGKTLVREALRKTAALYDNKQVYQGYYREAIAVNKEYYSITESKFQFSNQGSSGNLRSLLFETEKTKRIEDKNGHKLLILKPNHRNRFYPLEADVLSFEPAFWNYTSIENFDYELAGEVKYGAYVCYKIIFEQKEDNFHPFEKGVLYIEKKSMALLSAQWELSPKTRRHLSYTRYLHSNPLDYNVEIASSYREANYLLTDGKLMLQSTKSNTDIFVNQNDILRFENQLSIQGESIKSNKYITNSTFDSLNNDGKTKRILVKNAEYQIEPWVRHGLILPESYLLRDARFMHDVTMYR